MTNIISASAALCVRCVVRTFFGRLLASSSEEGDEVSTDGRGASGGAVARRGPGGADDGEWTLGLTTTGAKRCEPGSVGCWAMMIGRQAVGGRFCWSPVGSSERALGGRPRLRAGLGWQVSALPSCTHRPHGFFLRINHGQRKNSQKMIRFLVRQSRKVDTNQKKVGKGAGHLSQRACAWRHPEQACSETARDGCPTAPSPCIAALSWLAWCSPGPVFVIACFLSFPVFCGPFVSFRSVPFRFVSFGLFFPPWPWVLCVCHVAVSA